MEENTNLTLFPNSNQERYGVGYFLRTLERVKTLQLIKLEYFAFIVSSYDAKTKYIRISYQRNCIYDL